MKKIYNIFFGVALLVMLNGCSGCKEVNTLIDLTPPNGQYDQLILDSTFITSTIPPTQLKNVLIEDFSGDKCDNCPRAQKRGVTIENSYSGRISVIGIQCTSLAIPYNPNFDLRTKHGDDLITLEGNYDGLPAGDIDRKLSPLSPKHTVLVTDIFWDGIVSPGELSLPTKANIDKVNKSYDPSSHIFSMTSNVTFTQSSTDTFYLSCAITESGMVGPQLDANYHFNNGVNDTFIFQHVLRKMMDPWNGLKIAESPTAGKTYQVKFSTILDGKWVADNCKVVIFVHRRGAKNDVEQVMETTIK